MREDSDNLSPLDLSKYVFEVEPWNDVCQPQSWLTRRKIRYTDEDRIDALLLELGGIPKQKVRKKGLSAGSSGVNANWESADAEVEPLISRMDELINRLRRKRLLSTKRPTHLPKNNIDCPPFILERCYSRQFLFKKSFFSEGSGVTALKVWVSDPDKSLFSTEPFKWRGSYLFLTEVAFTSPEYRHFVSGCSALRMIANAVTDKNLYDRSGQEVLGRWDRRSLAEKLLALGATPMSNSYIECLYSIKTMTDEQFHPEAPLEGRVNDILAYPIFILEM